MAADLPDRQAAEIVAPLTLRHPEGPIFRNADSNPRDAQNFNNRFCRLQSKLGREILGGVEPDPKAVTALARTLPKTRRAGKDKVIVPKTDKELLREARKKLAGQVAAKAGTKYALTAITRSGRRPPSAISVLNAFRRQCGYHHQEDRE